eukprot:959308-Prymnesium_polylepis.1
MQLEWDNNNEIIYEYLMASIDVGWASRDLLKREYGPDVGFRGQELHIYVMAKCSADSEVKQRQVAQQLKEVLSVSATASPQEIEVVTAEWASFVAFRDRIVKALAKAALSRPSNEIGFPSVQNGRVARERKNWLNRERDTEESECAICTFGEP